MAGFAVSRDAYEKGLLPAWKKGYGKDVKVRQSYEGSGAQTRALLGGLEADVAALALAPEIEQLRAKDKVAEGPIFPAYSVVVIAVRPGNPKGIRRFADLARPGTQIVLPNPETSGAAKWNLGAVLAEYTEAGKDPASSSLPFPEVLASLRRNVVSFGKSGREAMQQWAGGVGDAVITWENEALLRKAKGTELEILYPPVTLKMEPPVALLKPARAAAKAFYTWLSTPDAAKVYAENHYRTATPGPEFPAVGKLVTVADLGGWPEIERVLFGASGAWTKSNP